MTREKRLTWLWDRCDQDFAITGVTQRYALVSYWWDGYNDCAAFALYVGDTLEELCKAAVEVAGRAQSVHAVYDLDTDTELTCTFTASFAPAEATL